MLPILILCLKYKKAIIAEKNGTVVFKMEANPAFRKRAANANRQKGIDIFVRLTIKIISQLLTISWCDPR